MFRWKSGAPQAPRQRWVYAGFALAVLGLAAAGQVQAATPVTSKVSAGPLTVVGKVNLTALANKVGGTTPPLAPAVAPKPSRFEFSVPPLLSMSPRGPALASPLSVTSANVSATSAPVGPAGFSAVAGFNGIDHFDERIVADNGNQFSTEPPDQALAVGNGFVVEAVNNAINIYDTKGHALLNRPVSMNRFMNQDSWVNRHVTPTQEGPNLSDPRAYYDAATQRFFVVEWATLNDAGGFPLGIAVQFVAVSASADPTADWNIYSFETTQEGLKGCPCFGDFQMMGIDHDGVFITMDLFNIYDSSFQGAKIYALSKLAMEAGTSTPVLEFTRRLQDFKIFPTVVPPGGSYASEANGTEYMVEATADLTANGVGKKLNIWAISNTASLSTSTPILYLNEVSTKSEAVDGTPFGLPPAVQPDGPRPLGGPGGLNDPVPLLNADDAGIGSTPVYLNGQIWAVLNTASAGATTLKNSVAWFDIAVSGGAPALTASVTKQGYVSAPGDTSLLYPAIAMPLSGKGAIGVTIVGPGNYPSTAVIPITAAGPGVIQITGLGALPEDGFTAYPQVLASANGVARWGDYGAAAVDESGALWVANEYIPDTAKYPRSTFANWGTFVTHVKP